MKKDKQLKDIKRRRTCKIVCVLLFLLISVIGICVHFNIIKIPFVVDLLERTEQKQEFGDFSGQLIGESYIPKEENIVYDNDSKTSGYVNNMILIFAYSDVPTVTKKWSGQYPSAMNHWYNNWDAISPIFKFSKDVRTAFYTTNAIESLNSCYRRLNKQRSVFPSSQALMKALYLSTFEIAKKWTMSIRN